jgi:hypothetical protein
MPYLTVTDDCDPTLSVTYQLDTLNLEYCGLHTVHNYTCYYASPWSMALFNLPLNYRFIWQIN